ncbi:MAG TPA: TonB-dependent receptor [Thermoanaerobaculia bacterium]|nr:TonB-dependent receptor [Thermoanaerobaculia bacterium]
MRHILLVAGVLGGGLPALALAQTAVPKFEETLVVSASLETEDKEDVPASVTVVDAKEIEARQADSLEEAVAVVPGVTVVQAGGPGQQTSLFLRGAESDQTLLLWNGIQLNNPYFGGVNWQLVSTDGVERVEVVRGPFSALYGSNALGGVVQVFTGSRQGGTVRLEGGDNGYGRAGLAAGGDAGPVRFDVTGHVRRGDGELENSSFDSDELMARGLWTLRPGTQLGLLVRGNDSDTGVPLSLGQPTLRRSISWREREVAVPFRAEAGSWEVEAQLSRTHFDSAFRDPDDAFGPASDTESEGLRGRTVITWRSSDRFWVAGGSEVERLEVTDSGSFGTNLDGARQRTWAAFGQASWGMGPLRLDAGLRRDDNDVYGAKTSLRAGAVVDLGGGFRARASYGEAFRAPSLGELFFPFFGNPDLRPETGNTWEAGIERVQNGWSVALAGFETRQRNLIDSNPVTFTAVNVGRAESRGLEAELGVRRGIWAARLDGTWLDTENLDTHEALLRRPKESASLVLTARPAPWTFNLETRWVGDRPDLDEATFTRRTNPSYTRIDLAAQWQATAHLAPYARVENAAGEEYEAVLGYPSPGRTWIGGVAVGF